MLHLVIVQHDRTCPGSVARTSVICQSSVGGGTDNQVLTLSHQDTNKSKTPAPVCLDTMSLADGTKNEHYQNTPRPGKANHSEDATSLSHALTYTHLCTSDTSSLYWKRPPPSFLQGTASGTRLVRQAAAHFLNPPWNDGETW
ncbi:hypothetical protein CFRS1_v012891 [Colletotrichum fructicola]|nr:hypothetical protein CFRS1_v012891 [Colletotrichum fructicola]